MLVNRALTLASSDPFLRKSGRFRKSNGMPASQRSDQIQLWQSGAI
jgi:hypothetical protein